MYRSLFLGIFTVLTSSGPAYAYVGPGVGAGTIAVVLGVLGAIVLWVFAVLWYPLKRLLRQRRSVTHQDSAST